MFEKTHVIRTASRGVPQCLDGDGIEDGAAISLTDCDDKNTGMLWDLVAETHQLINRKCPRTCVCVCVSSGENNVSRRVQTNRACA
jgi:hypothetical protein